MKFKIVLTGLLSAFLFSCDEVGMEKTEVSYEIVCVDDEVKEVAEYILSCLASSSASQEDNIYYISAECEKIAERAYCKHRKVTRQKLCNQVSDFGYCNWHAAYVTSINYEDINKTL